MNEVKKKKTTTKSGHETENEEEEIGVLAVIPANNVFNSTGRMQYKYTICIMLMV